tara:strand:+ start:691 stop:1083 length:393 start_codon:yes stop_codon:yes gene_type:complete
VVGRAGLAILLLAPLGACAAWQGMMTSGAPVADCPSVLRASAWVDHMPKVGSGPHKMIVAVKLDDDRPWRLTPEASAETSVRSLALSPGGPAVAGNAGYREPVGDDMPMAVSVTCGGREVARIDRIQVVM